MDHVEDQRAVLAAGRVAHLGADGAVKARQARLGWRQHGGKSTVARHRIGAAAIVGKGQRHLGGRAGARRRDAGCQRARDHERHAVAARLDRAQRERDRFPGRQVDPRLRSLQQDVRVAAAVVAAHRVHLGDGPVRIGLVGILRHRPRAGRILAALAVAAIGVVGQFVVFDQQLALARALVGCRRRPPARGRDLAEELGPRAAAAGPATGAGPGCSPLRSTSQPMAATSANSSASGSQRRQRATLPDDQRALFTTALRTTPTMPPQLPLA
ncbi:hypothetical protein G4G31_11280 [Massilia sp. Se16.2.3]|nr:hypothetical protein G4G31_11280 [Massilia sp. Se16.2.3]